MDQQTLLKPVTCEGIGLHSGKMIAMTLSPAAPGTGIEFIRTDITEEDHRVIPAKWDNVVDTRLCTVVANDSGASVGTVEHIMAALRGAGIDNLQIHINGPEIPIMDGSALPFLQLIDAAGITAQKTPRKTYRVTREVRVEEDGKHVILKPAERAIFKGIIDFDHPEIGQQDYELQLLNGNFRHDIADCRTFGFKNDAEFLRKQGLALGGSLDNAIILDDSAILNPEGLRRPDEFIRHKLLDAVGDLYLAGGTILGEYQGYKAGHALNNKILHKLFKTPGAVEEISSAAPAMQNLTVAAE